VKNTSRFELDGERDMTERFVRGNASRTTNGSGLGLSIARSFTETCGGSFRISTNADLFTAKVIFDRVFTETSE
jgi:signal transduction histidine kinase